MINEETLYAKQKTKSYNSFTHQIGAPGGEIEDIRSKNPKMMNYLEQGMEATRCWRILTHFFFRFSSGGVLFCGISSPLLKNRSYQT